MADNNQKKLAVITGGSRGIGKECAIELAKAGYNIVITYAGNDEAANKTVSEIKALNVEAEAYKFDVSNSDECKENIAKIIEKYGQIDALINNAGITRDNLMLRMTDDAWDRVINTNLNSMFYMTQPIVKAMMKKRQGVIINMSSIVGVYGNAGQTNYSAAKAGVIGLTKSLAKEVASRNIRVNAIAPGFIQTDMTKDLDTSKIVEAIPLKKLGEASDIAKTAKFLIVDAPYITGQVLCVDGGLVI
ncbi:MAG: 3-oxoacyl-[acyl-carrier-protein] reductase [Candidatus Melainabacteria bacterium LEY3_CP_29_8]|nr:MAG: 3-oxoacyl-[acyl-carrier-protein] reductase [Candidatus Melainabacteria bacterium LEY3_CP_29_8]